jgi:hypothetical protein
MPIATQGLKGENMGTLTNCYIKENDFVARDIAGETIIVPIKSKVGDLNSIFTLNEIGTIIWGLIDGRRSVSDIVNAVCERYEVKPEVAEKDTLQFLNTLKEAGLLRVSDE